MFLFQLDDLFEAIAEYGFRNVDWYDWLFIIGALLVGCIPVIMILYVIIDMFSDKEAKLVKKLRSCNDPSKLTRKQRLLHDVLSKKDQYKLTLHEQFLCLKRLEQLRQLTRNDRLALAKLYVDWFEDTDKDVDAAIRITKAISDDGSTWGTLKNAILLYDNGRIKEAFAQFRKLVNLDDDKQFPLLLNEDEGPAAAWYVAQIMLSTGNDSDTLLHAYNFILRAALFGYTPAVEFFAKPSPELLSLQLAYVTKHHKKEDTQSVLRDLFTGAYPLLDRAVTLYLPQADTPACAQRLFLLSRLAVRLGSSFSLYPLGLVYYGGIGTEKNMRLAREYLLKATEQKDRQAMLAMFMLGKIESQANHTADAMQWYEKSALRGYPAAAKKLAELYYEEDDYDKARQWNEIATALEQADAKANQPGSSL